MNADAPLDDAAVRAAGANDRAALTAMLARAFADDPAMSFVFPDPADRAQRLPRLFGLLFDADVRAGTRLMTAGGEAATFWRAPGLTEPGRIELLLRAWPMWRTFGGALGRGLAVSEAISAHFPTHDFWYLHIAGCDPMAQGRGLGAAAIRAGLERAGGFPTYLETATEKNVGFYRSLGFAVTREWAVPNGGPRFWSMLRG